MLFFSLLNILESDNYSYKNPSPHPEWDKLQLRKLERTIPDNDTAMIVYNSNPEFKNQVDVESRVPTYQKMYDAATL